jgi:hypothetical protein
MALSATRIVGQKRRKNRWVINNEVDVEEDVKKVISPFPRL